MFLLELSDSGPLRSPRPRKRPKNREKGRKRLEKPGEKMFESIAKAIALAVALAMAKACYPACPSGQSPRDSQTDPGEGGIQSNWASSERRGKQLQAGSENNQNVSQSNQKRTETIPVRFQHPTLADSILAMLSNIFCLDFSAFLVGPFPNIFGL